MTDIYNYIQQELKQFALSLCGYRIFDADDLIQDTCLRMLEKYNDKEYLEQKKLSGAIMQNLYIDKCRRRLTSPLVVSNNFPHIVEIQSLESKEIMNFIRGSKHKSFESLKLHIEGYKAKEIQKIYGDKTINVPLGNIMMARKKLKQYFRIAS